MLGVASGDSTVCLGSQHSVDIRFHAFFIQKKQKLKIYIFNSENKKQEATIGTNHNYKQGKHGNKDPQDNI